MTDFYDQLETRSVDEREAALFHQLQSMMAGARRMAPTLDQRLGDVALETIRDRSDLAKLPVLRKAELTELQSANPPFGGLTTRPASDFRHVFMSPGPIFEPGGDSNDWWRFARALWAVGFRRGDILHNCFAYHLTPAGQMFENGAQALGCTVMAGGVGQTEQQVAAMAGVRPTGYSGTPDYLKALLEKGDETGADLSSIRRALVSGGALFPSLRQGYAERGILCLQCYATADLGLISYETATPDGAPHPGMIIDEKIILEIVRPGTGDLVPEGEVGEIVVTALNPDYPLLRFATGDLSAIEMGQSPCGRTNTRIKGWMGRADQRTKIKGMFVDTPQVDAVVKRHPEIARARVVVTRDGDHDVFVMRCEGPADENLSARIAESVIDVFKLRGGVEIVAPGSLPNDGKVIEDARDYSA